MDPIRGISESVDPGSDANFFVYSFLAPDVSMVLDLNTTGGTYDVPLVTSGNFDAGTSLFFGYTGTEACTLVATCSQANVGLVGGATISGPVDIEATFTTPVPEPSSGLPVLMALLFVVVLLGRSRIAQSL